MPPHCAPLATVTSGSAVLASSSLVSAMFRERLGIADQSRATTPVTCGPAIEVPLKKEYAESLSATEERTFTPGATMSGLMRFEPSLVTGPRLLKLASDLVLPLIAPVVNDAA
jgi:hypothetical protein